MIRASRLRTGERVVAGGRVRVSALLETAQFGAREIWFSLPEEHAPAVTELADPFVLAALQPAMVEGAPLEIEGPVSRSLLANLDEAQGAWRAWRPPPSGPHGAGYHRIDLLAHDEIAEGPPSGRPGVAACSGGIDSLFTVHRQRAGLPPRARGELAAAVMVNGFDIPLSEPPEVFGRAFARNQRLLAGAGLPLIPVTTNIFGVAADWMDYHGLAVTAALTLLRDRHDFGLIGSTVRYEQLKLPYGSNPITDPLLGSDSFRIYNDGSGYSRLEKVVALGSGWPEALDRARVCYEGAELDRNCGRCYKCLGTLAQLRALGIEPRCFHHVPGDAQMARLIARLDIPATTRNWRELLAEADRRGVEGLWVEAVRRRLARARRRATAAAVRAELRDAAAPVLSAARRRARGVTTGFRLERSGGHAWVMTPAGRALAVEPGTAGALDAFRPDGRVTVFEGWAADAEGRAVADAVLLVDDGRVVAVAAPSVARPDVAEQLADPVLEQSGFRISVPSPARGGPPPARVRAIAVFADRAAELA